MPDTPSADERASFAGYDLDFRSGDLSRPDGTRIILPEQPFRILAILVRARGALVTREALRRELWPENTFVDFEHSLNAGVKRLRESIGDSAASPRFIETIPRRGYRFIAPIETVAEPTRASVEPRPDNAPPATIAIPRPRTRRRYAWLTLCGGGVMVLAVAAAVAAWLRTSTIAPAALLVDSRLIRLTTDAGLSLDPALSSDGSLVAYASDRQGGTGLDIWVQAAGGGTPRRLTSDEGNETEPDFSSDGAFLTYAAREKGGIFVVGVLGGDSRLVAAGTRARRPRFSPDGKWIAYWTGTPIWGELAYGPPGASGTLAVVPATGGTPRILAADMASARYPVWSPDSTRLLFVGDRVANGHDHGDWFTIPRDGGSAVETGAVEALQSAGVTGVPIPGGWSANGAVVFGVTGEDANVWDLPLSPITGKVSGAPRRLTFGSGHEQSPAINASGVVAFASVVENVDVWRIALDKKSGVGRNSFERVTSDAAADNMMNVTDDCTRMVFMSSRTRRREVWLRDLATGRDRQITFDGANNARISRNGTIIAVNKNAPQAKAELVPVDGGPSRPLCENCEVTDWSPDGSRLLLARSDPSRVMVRDVKSGRETELTSHPTWQLLQGRFSPDGQWVVFQTTNAPAVRQVYIVPADRTVPVPVAEWIPVVTDFGIQPSWSPDGSGVYYFSLRDGSFCPWLQPLDPRTHRPAGDPLAVAHLHHPGLNAVAGAAVTNEARGGFLYATLTERTGNIWLLRR